MSLPMESRLWKLTDNRRPARRHPPQPVRHPHRLDRPAFFHLLEQQLELMPRHLFKRLVFDRRNRPASLRPAHHSCKIYCRARLRRHGPPLQPGGLVQRLHRQRQFALHGRAGLSPLHGRKNGNLVAVLQKMFAALVVQPDGHAQGLFQLRQPGKTAE